MSPLISGCCWDSPFLSLIVCNWQKKSEKVRSLCYHNNPLPSGAEKSHMLFAPPVDVPAMFPDICSCNIPMIFHESPMNIFHQIPIKNQHGMEISEPPWILEVSEVWRFPRLPDMELAPKSSMFLSNLPMAYGSIQLWQRSCFKASNRSPPGGVERWWLATVTDYFAGIVSF